jgi:ribosomal protein L40E
MRVLIACESSGVVRRAFAACGHEAWSCDLLPAADGSPFHIQGDCLAVLDRGWDMLIAHPPCTYLTISAAWAFKDPDFVKYPGVGYHQKVKADTLTGAARRDARDDAITFTKRLWAAPVKRKAFENPRGFLSTWWRKPSQSIQPNQFGEDASKETCIWLDELPELVGTSFFPPRLVCGECKAVTPYGHRECMHCGSHTLRPRWSNQTDSGQNRLSPDDLRWQARSKTYQGIATAMAEQWGGIK